MSSVGFSKRCWSGSKQLKCRSRKWYSIRDPFWHRRIKLRIEQSKDWIVERVVPWKVEVTVD